MKDKSIDWSWHIRAQDSIAQHALTNSKRPETFVKGIFPTHLKKGSGPYVWDTKGNRYVDFICGLGSNILGYANPQCIDAGYRGMALGSSLSLSTIYEVELAEKIKEVIPFVSKMKFLKTGSEACSGAIKIARAKTGRTTVLSGGYHGWHDGFASLTPPANGVPPQIGIWHFRDDVSKITNETAAVIIEPIVTDLSDDRISLLRQIRERCNQTGTLLIFDEVITGFRTPRFTMSSKLGIEPDLICLGKAIANGMPLSVIGGKGRVMDECDYFISSTFAGDLPSIMSAFSCITQLQSQKFDLQYLWDRGERFLDGFNKLYPDKIRIQGYPTRGTFEGDPLTRALFWQEACLAGIIMGPSFFLNFSHLQLLDQLLNTFQDILLRIKNGQVTLLGEMPQTPYAQKVRER